MPNAVVDAVLFAQAYPRDSPTDAIAKTGRNVHRCRAADDAGAKGGAVVNTPDALTRWQEMSAATHDPSFELTVEEFAPILSAYKTLLESGYEFDAMMQGIMLCLARQIIGTDEDPDFDKDAADFEKDDPDEDCDGRLDTSGDRGPRGFWTDRTNPTWFPRLDENGRVMVTQNIHRGMHRRETV